VVATSVDPKLNKMENKNFQPFQKERGGYGI
jgi:hypothetical protein